MINYNKCISMSLYFLMCVCVCMCMYTHRWIGTEVTYCVYVPVLLCIHIFLACSLKESRDNDTTIVVNTLSI